MRIAVVTGAACWGERVHAVVVRQPGQHATGQELQEFCRGHVAGCKLPRSVAFADAVPMSGVGKILKRELRRMATGITSGTIQAACCSCGPTGSGNQRTSRQSS
jgi:acyl-CoA synthetase (AMP-forming)/AMP-acid ligase II